MIKLSRNAPERRSATFFECQNALPALHVDTAVFLLRGIVKNVAARCYFRAQNTRNTFAAGASPGPHYGELTALHQTP